MWDLISPARLDTRAQAEEAWSFMSEMGQQEIAFNTKESQCDGHLGKYEVGKDKKMLPNFKGNKKIQSR